MKPPFVIPPPTVTVNSIYILGVFQSKRAEPAAVAEPPQTQDAEIKEIIKKAFDAYDEDGSGFLERPEIRRLLDDACKELGTPIISDEHLNKIIDVVDNNSDGKFSVDELSSIIKPILQRQLG